MNSLSDKKIKNSVYEWLLFLVPSLLGLGCFMIPFNIDGSYMVLIAYISSKIRMYLQTNIPSMILIISIISGFITVAIKLFSSKMRINKSFFRTLFLPSWGWFSLRILGITLIVLVFYQSGSAMIYSANTGGMVFYELLPTLLSIFIVAPIFLPLLISFGLLEFFGVIMSKIMRPVFNLPGRSAIDCIASWLGDGSVAILMTNNQYENSQYTQKEAAIVATNFSLVSITFSLVVISQVGLEHMFLQFYLTVCVTGIIIAIIMPRIPPLSNKKDTFISGEKPNKKIEHIDGSLLRLATEKALKKIHSIESIQKIFVDGIKSSIELIICVLPSVMFIGTVALITSEYTPIFEYLGKPFIPLLELLKIPEAESAASTLLIGFSDMFIPSIVASSFESDLTKFFVAAISLIQLIYLSEIGALLLGSKIPISFLDLIVIFLQRTLIGLPIVALMAHCFF